MNKQKSEIQYAQTQGSNWSNIQKHKKSIIISKFLQKNIKLPWHFIILPLRSDDLFIVLTFHCLDTSISTDGHFISWHWKVFIIFEKWGSSYERSFINEDSSLPLYNKGWDYAADNYKANISTIMLMQSMLRRYLLQLPSFNIFKSCQTPSNSFSWDFRAHNWEKISMLKEKITTDDLFYSCTNRIRLK